MKFPAVIRLDESDTKVFARAAEPGELAVPGTFAFADLDLEALAGKERQGFVSGWLGTESFGRATLVAVREIDEEDFEAVVRRLSGHFVEHYGAPDVLAALDPARREADYAAGLCEHDRNTLLAVEREAGADGIIERFRVVAPPSSGMTHAGVWTVTEEEDG